MLKEIDISEVPEKGTFGVAPTEVSLFCGCTLDEFMASEIKTAEVTGWPGGDPKTNREAASRLSSMRSKIRSKKLDGVECVLRGKRIFVMKTTVRKAGGRRA